MPRKITVCGRVHLGPICINGGKLQEPMCMACGCYVSQAEREVVGRMWTTVKNMLRQYKRDDA